VGKRAHFAALFVLTLSLTAPGTTLVFFYDEGCPHCARVEAFLERIQPDYPQLEIVRYSVREEESLDLLDQLLEAYGIPGLSWTTPVIFIGEVADIGGTFYRPGQDPQPLTGRAEELTLEDAIREAIAKNAPSPLTKAEGASAGLAEKLTVPAVVLAAAADSVNPCTFAVLVLLLGTLLVAGRRGKVLQAGLAFTSAIYISYFLMGIGIFSAIQAAGVQRPFILSVSILAILLGLWNVKDYFAYGKWFTIEVPQRWRPMVKRLTSSVVSVPGAFAVGVLDCPGDPVSSLLQPDLHLAASCDHVWGALWVHDDGAGGEVALSAAGEAAPHLRGGDVPPWGGDDRLLGARVHLEREVCTQVGQAGPLVGGDLLRGPRAEELSRVDEVGAVGDLEGIPYVVVADGDPDPFLG